ncbi:MAG: aminopeptidase P family protein [Chloroflexi bacterium]|nr:aminopeptidase P family protein [Chloroflexota bacterium]
MKARNANIRASGMLECFMGDEAPVGNAWWLSSSFFVFFESIRKSWQKMNYEGRLIEIRQEMVKRNVGMMFLPHSANLWYATGIPRKTPEITVAEDHGDYVTGAYIGIDRIIFIGSPKHEGFYRAEANNKPWINAVRIVDERERPEDVLAEVVRQFDLRGKEISLDNRAWAKTILAFQRLLPDNHFSLASDIIMPLRMIKDADEIAVMQKIAAITDEVFGKVLKSVRLGVTEFDIAQEIDYQFIKCGADSLVWPSTVRFTRPSKGYEARGATEKYSDGGLEPGHAITFDFAACYQGYCSDFGRTAFAGDPPPEFTKAHDFVMSTQAEAIASMVGGKITAAEVENKARSALENAGLEFLPPRLGHAIGLAVHEIPYLGRCEGAVLQSGMTFTVEPSVRLPDGRSCRVEDVVLVTDSGGVTLTNYHKRLTVI